MKNNRRPLQERQNIRMDAFLLAVLMFVQTVSPSFLFGGRKVETRHIPFISDRQESHPTNRIESEQPLSEATEKDIQEQVKKIGLTAPMIPGGPDQPEVQSFTPVGTDGMVDPFSGDFSYNIPLLDVDGYPINLAYNAGVGMDQEASWVGLGWNLNPGVINRNMRGIPDDFNGTDQIVQEYNQKPNWTVGTSVGFNYELFSIDLSSIPGGDDGGLGLSASLGVQYNNYTGYGADFSIGPSFNIAKKMGFEVGIQFTGSSQGGASIGGNIALSDGNKKSDKVVNKLSIGSSFNSRQGLQQVSVNLSQERKLTTNSKHIKKDRSVGHEGIGNGLGSSFNFGMSSYVSQIPFETNANSFTARFKLGGDAVGNDPSGSFSGFFSKSSIANNSKTLPAYGYIHLEKGQSNSRSMLDFNRENDASYTKNTPALPIPHLMYDVYSVSGHGISGSYRMDRKDIGYVFDPYITNSSNSYTVGGEVGLGATFKAGIDVGAVFTNGSSGVWTSGNDAAGKIRFNSSTNHFRDASELAYDESDAQFQNIGGDKPAYFQLSNTKKLSGTLRTSTGTHNPNNSKSLYFKRNQPLTSWTVQEIKNGYGITKLPATAYANTQSGINHHIGAFTVTKTDGSRYYYGLPAYSKTQKNVSFAVGDGKTSGLTPDWNTRLVTYSTQDASIGNNRGLDNHYNSQTVPKYTHSYMLTAVLGADYMDSDNIPGPSKDDLGSYVEFKYKPVEHYKWRNPVESSKAFHDRGLNTDPTDDKANYIYGEKELWYLDTIKTKNHILIFYTTDRKDAVSVTGEHGGISSSNVKMQKLDSIKLYSRPDFEAFGAAAVPIKAVHFRYNYNLCANYPGNYESGGGKLTLEKVWFTYENSYKGERTPYEFYYDVNPGYNANNVDRWGTYKPNPSGLTGNEATGPLSNSDFPYTGYDKTNMDIWASAWNLSRITLPSGGRIQVFYESDDYAYVQHKRAKQMFKIVNVEGCSGSNCSVSDDSNENRKLYFEMIPGTVIQEYGSPGDVIYFKALLSMNEAGSSFDYVPGYAVIESIGTEGGNGYVKLKPGKLKDSESETYNPLSISGVQFARNYLSRMIPPSSQTNPQSEDVDFLDIANSLIGAFTSFGELFTGPNKPIWNKQIGTVLVKNKSWLRLNNPDYQKLGGGHRVREIRTYDAWDDMTPNGEESFYGQQYIYSFDSKSSGVASYEPQIGGEENVWRMYVANDIKMTWAPDIRNYMEEPFGEQFFPSPSVGYSKVLVRNIEREGVVRTATGHTINEFFTAKDFPTIVERTSVDKKPSKFNLNLLLYAKSEDMMATSQGFVIENNDMHGKPRLVEIYAEGQSAPYSSVTYHYKSAIRTIEKIAANQLVNDVRVITPSGTIKTVVVGRTYEAVADFRENKSKMKSGNLGINLNYTIPFIFIPMILGANYSDSKTEYRSAVFAKTIERKGILYKTVAVDYNSKVETENLAYDSETGEVLLTSVNNGFRDTTYNFTYPAHWIYKGMGQAYKNLAYTSAVSKTFTDGYSSGFNSGQLYEGDEVMVIQSGNYIKGWVTESGVEGVRVLQKDGTPLNGTISYLKVLRSGNRNLQSTSVGTVALMKNPLNTLSGNVFDEVLSAQSIEYGQAWKTFCDCNDAATGNPYISGLKGNWNPKTTYLHLSDRTQTFENNNTDIRNDGLMTSFLPFFRLANGNWSINKENWTYTSEVSEFSPFGQPIETVDALDRYAATQIGYNQTLPVAVVANSMRKETGFDGFEDYLFESCPDNHFRFATTSIISDTVAHTGRYSITVNAGNPVIFQKQIAEACDVESPCDFSQYIVRTLPEKVYVMDSHGISMTYEVIYGSPTPIITETTGGILLTFNSSEAFRVEVKLTNSEGCVSIVPIRGFGS
jgi:hypothetical protein